MNMRIMPATTTQSLRDSLLVSMLDLPEALAVPAP